MTLLQLQYFRVLAGTLHYTRTAEALHISQPALSCAISELERELGVPLFHRRNRRIELTQSGRQFLPYAEKALDLLREGRDVIDSLSGQRSSAVRLGYFHSLSSSFIPMLVNGFRQRQQESGSGEQEIRFLFTEAPDLDILSQLKDGELDICFGLSSPETWGGRFPDIQAAELFRQTLYLAVPRGHRLAERRTVRTEDFSGEPQIMLGRSSALRVQMDRIFSRRGIIPHIAFEVKECNAALQYVGLNLGVAVLPYVPAMNSGKIATVSIEEDGDRDEFVRSVYLMHHRTRNMSAAVIRVLEYIREMSANHAAEQARQQPY